MMQGIKLVTFNVRELIPGDIVKLWPTSVFQAAIVPVICLFGTHEESIEFRYSILVDSLISSYHAEKQGD